MAFIPKDVSTSSSESCSPVLLPMKGHSPTSKLPLFSQLTILLPSPRENSAKRRWAENIRVFIADRWFLLVLGVLITFSSQVQVPASQQEIKTTIITYLCVSIIFLVTGCTLSTQTLIDNYSKWKIHLFVQGQCFLLTSAVVFGIVSAAATNKDFMDPWLLIGIIFTGCVPTTISSNVIMTRKAHGNTALTVVETTIGNFLGPFLTPFLVQLYTGTSTWWTDVLPHNRGSYAEIYRRVFKQLGLSLFLPMFIGQIIQHLFPAQTKKFFNDWKFSKLSSFAFLIIIWQTFDQAFSANAFSSVKASNLIFIVFISIAYFALWLVICLATSVGWLSRKDTVAVAYCVPAKTPALGIALSNVLFVGLSRLEASKIQVPMVIFQGLQVFLSSLLIPAFRNWVAAEVIEDEEKEPDCST